MPVTSSNSPHITLTHPKSRFDNFSDQTHPSSWSKLPICAKSGVVFMSGQESNPKVQGNSENFNIENVAQTFLWASIHVGTIDAISFLENFQCLSFHRQRHRHPCPGHFSKK